MLFSSALAIPFTLFSFFPSLLTNLTSNSRVFNIVKITLGFVEFALAFKFLSIIDQVYHLDFFTKDINIAIWMAILLLLGLYYIDKIRFSGEKKLESINPIRLVLSIICFSFFIYLLPGMFGSPLNALSGYLPPQVTHSYDLLSIIRDQNMKKPNEISYSDLDIKHQDRLKLPHGIQSFFDIEEALVVSKEYNKPILINFTGHGCVNCRKMEEKVWSDIDILSTLKQKYIIVSLFVDDRTKLSKNEQYYSTYSGKLITTIGGMNSDYQIANFRTNAQPFYVIINAEEEKLITPIGYEPKKFNEFLQRGLEAFNKQL